MSAYIVSQDHIDYLVSAAIQAGIGNAGGVYFDPTGTGHRGMYERVGLDNADTFGAMLLRENVASVRYRYGEDRDDLPGPIPTPNPDTYRHTPFGSIFHTISLNPVQVLKALDCYEYQSCEHPGWKDSEARRIVDVLRSRTIGNLPGYDDALWEVDRTALAGENVARRAKDRDADTPVTFTLHTLTDGSGVVVHRNRAYRIIGGVAGFNASDTEHARELIEAGDDAGLRDWQFPSITQEAAAYVAATFPAVGQE